MQGLWRWWRGGFWRRWRRRRWRPVPQSAVSASTHHQFAQALAAAIAVSPPAGYEFTSAVPPPILSPPWDLGQPSARPRSTVQKKKLRGVFCPTSSSGHTVVEYTAAMHRQPVQTILGTWEAESSRFLCGLGGLDSRVREVVEEMPRCYFLFPSLIASVTD